MLSEADKALRRTGIGSSDVSAIVGVNPYRTKHTVYLDKRGLLDDDPPTLGMRIGHIAEDLIATLYAEETGATLVASPSIRHPKHDWIVGTPDRLVVGMRRIIEIKWVGWRVASAWERNEDAVPDYVRTQAEWLMDLTDADECDVPTIIGGDEFRIYRLKRNPDLFDVLRERAERFWFDHVIAGVPPPADESEDARRMLTTIFRRDDGNMIAAPDAAYEWVNRKVAADAAIDAATAERDLACNKLREMIGDASGILGLGFKATWKADKRGQRSLRVKVFEEKRKAA
mgnify:FL=1